MTYARQKWRLESVHSHGLRRLLYIGMQDRDSERTGLLSMYILLIQRRLLWLGHVHRMKPDHIPRVILYGKLREGVRRAGRPLFRYKDVCQRDLRRAKRHQHLGGHC